MILVPLVSVTDMIDWYSSSLESLVSPLDSRPSTIVLRPNGCLGGMSCTTFQETLETALEWTTDTVVVDMLWVEAVQAEGISSLIAALDRATELGKTLSLRSMDVDTHAAIEAHFERA